MGECYLWDVGLLDWLSVLIILLSGVLLLLL